MEPAFTVSGFFVGILVGITGVGGGSLMTPILVLLFGVPASTAVGTDLLFAAVTKGFGTALHGFNKSVSWRVVGRLAAGSIPASVASLWVIEHLIKPDAIKGIITTGLGFALVLTSLTILLQPAIKHWLGRKAALSMIPSKLSANTDEAELLAEEAACEKRPAATWSTVFVGVVLGILVTITSVGAGALGVMVLMALYPKVRSVRIVGTDIAHAVPLTLVAGLGHAANGSVNLGMLGALLLGSIPGIMIGSHLAFRLPERALKRALAAILMVVGSKLLLA
jgi:uncharacterized protein